MGGKIHLRKTLLPLLIIAALVVFVFPQPAANAATSLEEINRKIKEAERKIAQSEANKKNAQKEIKLIDKEEKELEKEIRELSKQIEEKLILISEKEQEIAATEDNLRRTAQALDEAIDRVQARDELLRARVRLMYTNGAVSYLDVLLSSTSFTDFLDRFRSLSLIVEQDRQILEDNIRDKELIEASKAQIEMDLARLEEAYDVLLAEKQSLEEKEKEKEVRIAELNQRREHLEEITEEEERALIEAMKLKSELVKERAKLVEHSGKFLWPLDGDYPITSNFGYRIHPIHKVKKLHAGTDIGAPKGTKVLAAGSGIVITAKSWGGYGNAVMIDHGNGKWTLYAHLNKIRVKEGDEVKSGQHIGDVGKTGTATGYHLHYEVRINSEPVDPMKHTLSFQR
jgi:murein DD-endopeptidase MepM/ murein hydrolase activator NlpD